MNGFEYVRTRRNLGVEAVGDQASGKGSTITDFVIMKAPKVIKSSNCLIPSQRSERM